MQTREDFTQLVRLCVSNAEEKYGKLPPLGIYFDIKSTRVAGLACSRVRAGQRIYFLRFNPEAMRVDWEYMTHENIPHEVAHFVCQALPHLGGKGHNDVWRRVAQSLGCKGRRCHSMDLSAAPGARKTNRYIYKLPSGMEISVGPKHHKQIQLYGAAAGIHVKRTREMLDRHHYQQAA